MTTGVTSFAQDSFINFENLVRGNGNKSVTGMSGGNIMVGGTGTDRIDAGAGDDQIIGSAGFGIDTIYRGAGEDTIMTSAGDVYDGGDDTIISSQVDYETLSGRNGIDTLDISASKANEFEWNMTTGATAYVQDSFLGFENLILANGTNTVTGTSGVNTITGGSGMNRIIGGAGSDTIYGGGGNDDLIGGRGN